MHRLVTALILLTCWNFSLGWTTGEGTVEEVLAVVGGMPILSSDLALAEHVNLVPEEAGESAADHASRLLDARIRLELQFRDLEASGFLHRLVLDPEAATAQLLISSGDPDVLRSRLEHLGLTWADVEGLGLRVAAAQAYVEQRLRPRVAVSFEEVEAVYFNELAPELSAAGQPLPELQAVRQEIYSLITERKLNDEITSWIAEARERQEITRFVR